MDVIIASHMSLPATALKFRGLTVLFADCSMKPVHKVAFPPLPIASIRILVLMIVALAVAGSGAANMTPPFHENGAITFLMNGRCAIFREI